MSQRQLATSQSDASLIDPACLGRQLLAGNSRELRKSLPNPLALLHDNSSAMWIRLFENTWRPVVVALLAQVTR